MREMSTTLTRQPREMSVMCVKFNGERIIRRYLHTCEDVEAFENTSDIITEFVTGLDEHGYEIVKKEHYKK